MFYSGVMQERKEKRNKKHKMSMSVFGAGASRVFF